jgi:hypothetical protein
VFLADVAQQILECLAQSAFVVRASNAAQVV